MDKDKLIETALGAAATDEVSIPIGNIATTDGPGEGPTPLEPKKEKRKVWTLNEGMAWNPLTSFPRNAPCPCGSQIKFKKCHYGKIEEAVPAENTKEIREMVKLTKEARKRL